MKKINHLKFHYFSYRIILLSFWFVIIILGLIWFGLSGTMKTFFDILIPTLFFKFALLGIYEEKENTSIFLNININKKAYFWADIINLIIICLINTLMFMGIYYLFTTFELIDSQLSTTFFVSLFLLQVCCNRCFYLLTIYFNKFSFIILTCLLFIFLLFDPLNLINSFIQFNNLQLLNTTLLSGVVMMELLIMLVIGRNNVIFKKSLSSR